MTNSVMRKQVHKYVDQVDENILAIVHQLLEREVSMYEYELTAADKRIIEKRVADFDSGKDKGIPAATVSRKIRAKLKAIKK